VGDRIQRAELDMRSRFAELVRGSWRQSRPEKDRDAAIVEFVDTAGFPFIVD